MRLPRPWVTFTITGVTAAAWFGAVLFGAQDTVVAAAGFIPARAALVAQPAEVVPFWATPLTSTLVHGSSLHLMMNLLLLLFCGRYVEAVLGRWLFLLLYIVCAYAGAAAFWLWHAGSLVVLIGASGAISGLLAAQALLFQSDRTGRRGPSSDLLHALWLAAAWIGLQLLVGFADQGPISPEAHIGGFLAGLVLTRPLLRLRERARRH